MYPQKAGSYYLGIIEYQIVVAVFFFWREHAFSSTKCMEGSGCNSGKLTEWV